MRTILFWIAVLTPLLTAASKVLNGDMTWQSAIAWLLIEAPVAIGGALLSPPGEITAKESP